jgi:hypothetical protein
VVVELDDAEPRPADRYPQFRELVVHAVAETIPEAEEDDRIEGIIQRLFWATPGWGDNPTPPPWRAVNAQHWQGEQPMYWT